MVLKFLAAGLISAVLAGGAMYLAMDDDMVARLRAEGDRLRLADSIPDLRGNDAIKPDDPSVMDRLLGRDAANSSQPDEGEPSEQPDPSAAHEDLSEGSRIGRRVEQPVEEPRRSWLSDFLPGRETSETDIRVRGESSNPKSVDPQLFETLLTQADMLNIPDAKDDALLNILTFALASDAYDVAAEIIPKLSSPELRDTARQRVGVRHAQAGRTADAFAVLDDVEVEPLAVPIRLEIIRAITQTEPAR